MEGVEEEVHRALEGHLAMTVEATVAHLLMEVMTEVDMTAMVVGEAMDEDMMIVLAMAETMIEGMIVVTIETEAMVMMIEDEREVRHQRNGSELLSVVSISAGDCLVAFVHDFHNGLRVMDYNNAMVIDTVMVYSCCKLL